MVNKMYSPVSLYFFCLIVHYYMIQWDFGTRCIPRYDKISINPEGEGDHVILLRHVNPAMTFFQTAALILSQGNSTYLEQSVPQYLPSEHDPFCFLGLRWLWDWLDHLLVIKLFLLRSLGTHLLKLFRNLVHSSLPRVNVIILHVCWWAPWLVIYLVSQIASFCEKCAVFSHEM